MYLGLKMAQKVWLMLTVSEPLDVLGRPVAMGNRTNLHSDCRIYKPKKILNTGTLCKNQTFNHMSRSANTRHFLLFYKK